MGDFTVKVKDQLKLEVICKIESGVLSREDGRSLLHVSERTLRRYIKKYREQGIGFLRHGNCLRKPLNKTPDPIKEDTKKINASSLKKPHSLSKKYKLILKENL